MTNNKKDKTIRNKITTIVVTCFTIGLVLTVLTKLPFFALTTALSVPMCLNAPIKNWIES